MPFLRVLDQSILNTVLEFELAYDNTVVRHFSHYTKETHLRDQDFFLKKGNQLVTGRATSDNLNVGAGKTTPPLGWATVYQRMDISFVDLKIPHN